MATIEGIPQKYLNAIYWKVIARHNHICSRYNENTIWDLVANDYTMLVSSKEPELDIYSLVLNLRRRNKYLCSFSNFAMSECNLHAYLLRLLLKFRFSTNDTYERKVLPELEQLLGDLGKYTDDDAVRMNELPPCPVTDQPAPTTEERNDLQAPINIRCKLLTHFIDPDGSIAAVRGNKKKMGKLMAILTGYSESACENYYNLPDFNREVNQTTIDKINALLHDMKIDFMV